MPPPDDVIEDHGGLARRKTFERIEAEVVTTGGLFPLKGLPSDATRRRMIVWRTGTPSRLSAGTQQQADRRSADGIDRPRQYQASRSEK